MMMSWISINQPTPEMKSNMKKNLIALGAMLMATLSLTNCMKETQVAPDAVGIPYTIYAGLDTDTKTVNDGLSTRWAEDDTLNVFHTEAGTDWYSENTKFTVSDVETGKFETDLLNGELSDVNDWFVLYPYNSHIISPANVAAGYLPVGGKAGNPQVQTGNSNMDHIAGPNYPMWGVAMGVESQELPYVRMTHLSSLVEVVVTNNAGVEAKVKSLSMAAAEDITGTYYIDFTTDEPSFEGSGDSYVSNVVKLNVAEGEYIPAGESATFYFAIKPFTAYAGDFLSLSVNGAEKTYELTEDVTFAPGKIKTLTFSLDEYVELVPGPLTSNMVWTLGEKAYSEVATINDEAEVPVLKLGNSSVAGTATITVPAGTTKLGFYAVSWNGKAAVLGLMDGEDVVAEVEPPVNEGASNNSPYTIYEDPELCYFEIEVNADEDKEYTLTTTGSNNRVIIWGLNYYDADGNLGEDQTPAEPEPEDPVEPTPDGETFTWDLTIADYLEADENQVQWYSDYAIMMLEKAESSTVANNYLGGGTYDDKDCVHTRVYKGQILTVFPVATYMPVKTVFTATSASYAEKFVNSTWTNAVVESEGAVVTVTPEDPTLPVAVTISAATRFTDVTVHYVYDETFVPSEPSEPEPDDPVEPEPDQPGEAIAVTVAEFLAAAEDDTLYELTGEIQNVAHTKYGNFYLADETGSVYIYGLVDENGAYIFTDLGLKAGDVITVVGKRGSYYDTIEMIDALYISHVPGEGTEPEPEPEPDQPGEIIPATVAEVLAAEVDANVWYEITGKIVNIANTTFGNFDLMDETGSIYVYGLTATQVESNDRSFESLGLKVGDVVTLIGTRSEYNGSPQVGGPAYYVSHEAGEPEPEVPADGTVASAVFADMGYENAQVVADEPIWIDENVCLVFSKGAANTDPAYYNSGSAIRMYQNGATLEVSASGKTITSIEFTFSSGHYYMEPDCGEFSAESAVRTWTGEAETVVFTSTGTDKNHRAYVSAVKVTYAD